MAGQVLVFQQQRDHNLYKLRAWEGLTPDTKELIRLITLSDETRPVGSYKFKAHRYPSDIDIFEKFRACCDKKTATAEIVTKLQDLVREVNGHDDVYWGDFKAGIDVRYYADPDFLISPKECRNHLKNIAGYLSDSEYEQLANLVNDPEEFKEELRQLYTLRWTPVEIIDGEKTLKNSGGVITLGQAINQNSIVKLDLWAPIDGMYNEITNFFIFEQEDNEGNVTVLNMELGNRKDSLLHDIQKYSTREHYNPLKVAKRLWNWSIITKDRELSRRLAPLFSSGVAVLNQIGGELDTVIKLIKKYELTNVPIETIQKQLETYKLKLNNINDIDFNEKQLYRLLDEAIKSLKQRDENGLIARLSILIEQLKKIIIHYSDIYLKENRGRTRGSTPPPLTPCCVNRGSTPSPFNPLLRKQGEHPSPFNPLLRKQGEHPLPL